MESLPVEVQEKGRGVGLMGFLLRAVEFCSFHVALHKDPLAICRGGRGREASSGWMSGRKRAQG